MRISEIYTLISSVDYPFAGNRIATLVAIEQLALTEGLPVFALDYSAPEFARRYPINELDAVPASQRPSQYHAWRSVILNAQMLCSPQDTDGDPWKSLGRALRISSGNRALSLSELVLFLPIGTLPAQVTDALIQSIYEQLPTEKETRFRNALNLFKRSFSVDLAKQTGLFPPVEPKSLPQPRDHFNLSLMSPKIKKWRDMFSDAKILNALDYINRVAVSGLVLNGETDTLEDLRRALISLPDPQSVGVRPITPHNFQVYVTTLIRNLGGRNYRLTDVEQAWADLNKAARAAGCETSRLFTIAMPASKRKIFPHQVTSEVALSLVKTHLESSTKSASRRACEDLDALRGKIPAGLLPPEPIGVGRIVYIPKPAPAPVGPVEGAWNDLFSTIRQNYHLSKDYKNLWYVKSKALEDGITPSEITQAWLEALRDKCPRDCLNWVYGAVYDLKKIQGFEHLSPLWKRRDRHGNIREGIAQPLETLIAEMGLAPTSHRSIRLAVGILAETETAEGCETLDSLLDIDLNSVIWGDAQKQASSHVQKLLTIKRFRALPWTPSWQELHKLVVETGTTVSKNPVPKVLSWNPGCDPAGLTLEWAKTTDLKLRSTLTNPPHGRADLAITLANQLALFDKLHDVPSVRASGLMPKRIGNIR